MNVIQLLTGGLAIIVASTVCTSDVAQVRGDGFTLTGTIATPGARSSMNGSGFALSGSALFDDDTPVMGDAGDGFTLRSAAREIPVPVVTAQLGDGPMPAHVDVNGDAIVDVADLAAVLDAWGADDSAADVNADGTVDSADLQAVLAELGRDE